MRGTYSVSGQDIRNARKAAGFTQRQLSEKAVLHVNSVKRLERFRFVPRSSSHALKRCAAHLPALSSIETRESPARASIEREEHFLEAITRAQYGVKAKPIWRPRKADRPRCGAKTRKGGSCQAPARANGRCRMHGGLSTGAKTPDGRQRIREAQFRRWKRHFQNNSETMTNV